VLVVDDAATIGTPKLARLRDHAQQAGSNVVLVGDPCRLPEIGHALEQPGPVQGARVRLLRRRRGTIYGIAAAFNDDMTRVVAIRVASLAPAADGSDASWTERGSIPVDEVHAGGGLQAVCTPWGGLYSLNISEPSVMHEVARDREVFDGSRTEIPGGVRSVQVADDGVLLASVSPQGLAVQRLRADGSLESVGNDPSYQDSDAHVVSVSGQLINFLPALRYDAGAQELTTRVSS
jgi:hypothetical protein